MEQKRNYQREMEEVLRQIDGDFPGPGEVSSEGNAAGPGNASAGPGKKSLLLHACCGPCSSYCIEALVNHFDITIYYYNPNIHPETEYTRRLDELRKFLVRFPPALSGAVKLVEDTYDPEEFFAATGVREEPALQEEQERGERCRRCYQFRMSRAYDYALRNGFDWFTTTLSISPHKDAEKINVIGRQLESEAGARSGTAGKKLTRFLPSDFKKKGGFLRSTQLSQEYGLWRQDYCGCVYSMR